MVFEDPQTKDSLKGENHVYGWPGENTGKSNPYFRYEGKTREEHNLVILKIPT